MSWSQEELVAAAYAAVFVFVLVYVAIIAAKLARLQRETAELVELTRAKQGRRVVILRTPTYAATVLLRPLPLQAPTAFVRIRPRGAKPCGEAKPRRARRCASMRPAKRP